MILHGIHECEDGRASFRQQQDTGSALMGDAAQEVAGASAPDQSLVKFVASFFMAWPLNWFSGLSEIYILLIFFLDRIDSVLCNKNPG